MVRAGVVMAAAAGLSLQRCVLVTTAAAAGSSVLSLSPTFSLSRACVCYLQFEDGQDGEGVTSSALVVAPKWVHCCTQPLRKHRERRKLYSTGDKFPLSTYDTILPIYARLVIMGRTPAYLCGPIFCACALSCFSAR